MNKSFNSTPHRAVKTIDRTPSPHAIPKTSDRKPSIAKARRLLGWEPKVTLDDALAHTVDAFLEDWIRSEAAAAPSAGD